MLVLQAFRLPPYLPCCAWSKTRDTGATTSHGVHARTGTLSSPKDPDVDGATRPG